MKDKLKTIIKNAEQYIRQHTTLVLGSVTALLCLAIISSQMMRIAKTRAETTDLMAEIQALQNEIQNEQLRYANLRDEQSRLTADRNAIIDNFLANNPLDATDVQSLQESLNFNRVMAGSTPISGNGVVLLLSDPAGIDYATATAADIIHEQDVMSAVNLLKANGAVAMAVNGERLTATSKLICNGPTILVNRRLLSAPFVISAVGDSESMITAIENSTRITNLKLTGKRVEYSRHESMEIPAFNDQVIVDQSLEQLKEVLES